ncbi:predicted protein [Naegleria gruberi]|uniref:Predicted protein n=1 Tax=Naegleria gruberi TaxID=5762 RepID=D2W2Q6_NAEGR|nr:uncharacterized protein NAEGRDRAFT_59953 [Naegleria gruberi]EFC36660.1 predicted protein [Naegleria gruberi]|eukprot:XP_002669404.1 predicted protein [Naegleria gruberi strain NEG-M]
METQDSVTVKLFKPLNHDTNPYLFVNDEHSDTSSDVSSNREFQNMIEDLRRERKQMEQQSLYESQLHSSRHSSSAEEEINSSTFTTDLDTIQALNVLQNYILKEYETLKSKITRELKESWTIIDENGNSVDDEMSIQSLYLEHYKINKIFHERLTAIYNSFNREYFSFSKATTLLELHNATTEISAHYDRMSLKFSKASKSFRQVPEIQIVQSSPIVKKGMSSLYEDIESDGEESDDDSVVEQVEGSILTENALQQYRNDTNEHDYSPAYSIVTSSTVLTGPFSPLITPVNPVQNNNIFDDNHSIHTVTEDGSIEDENNNQSTDSVKTVHRIATTPKLTSNSFFALPSELDGSTIVTELLRVIVEQGLQISETFNKYYANEFYKNAKLSQSESK